jgi:hypothetical protein
MLATNDSNEQKASEIKQKIDSLCNFEGEDLKDEMQALKKALQENPSACSLLHDEDIGVMVAAIRKIVGVAVASATSATSKPKKAAVKKYTAAELEAALAEVSDDDL